MWWHDPRPLIRFAAVASLAALLGGCFQPLYGSATATGGGSLVEALRLTDIPPIDAASGSPEARIANQVRDELLFGLEGGAGSPPSPRYRLRVRLISTQRAVIVDPVTGRTDIGNYALTAVYTLTDAANGRVLREGSTATRVSWDAPGQQQRFARERGQRDAENRAAKVIAETIKAQVAAYFVAGS